MGMKLPLEVLRRIPRVATCDVATKPPRVKRGTGRVGKAKAEHCVRHVAGQMNKTEAAYAAHLETLKLAGLIQWWAFEKVKLMLSQGDGATCSYTPDFCVVAKSGRVEFDEVKGFERDDAVVKFKWAAAAYPWAQFRMVKRKGGGWEYSRTLNTAAAVPA